jgi:hypothetical protein
MKNFTLNRSGLIILGVSGIALSSQAAVISLGQTNYLQNFDYPALAKSGMNNTALPQGWTFLETGRGANNNYPADSGTDDEGGLHSYGAQGSNDRALGLLREGSLSGMFGAAFKNDRSGPITKITISYTGEEWRLGTAGRQDRLDFQYSLNASSLSTGTWIDANALDFVTPNTVGVGAHDGNAPANRTLVSGTINFLNIPKGATFWIRWTDFDAAGTDDGLAIDNFSLVAVPEPGSYLAGLGTLGFLSCFCWRQRRSIGSRPALTP